MTATYDEILVIADRPPRADDPADRRLLQLVRQLRVSVPDARLVLACTEAVDPDEDAPHHPDPWLSPRSWRTWLDEHRLQFTIVVLAGLAAVERLAADVRRTQPQADVVVLLSAIPQPGPLDSDRFSVAEERRGAALADDERAERDRRALSSADVALCATVDERRRAAEAGIRVLDYPTIVQAQPVDAEGRQGILSWGRFGTEPGDPDEEAAWIVTNSIAPLIHSLRPETPITVALENAPTGFAHLAPDRTLDGALAHASLLLVARPFGAEPSWLLDAAAAAGVPVVARRGSVGDPSVLIADDDAELARFAVRLLRERDLWIRSARLLQESRRDAAAVAANALQQLLQASGIEVHLGAGFAPLPLEARPDFAQRLQAISEQGQIQSAGLAEHRRLVSSYRHADLPPDDLSPAHGYEKWWDAHDDPDPAAIDDRLRSLDHRPTISLLVPVYNTDPTTLETTIQSVIAQHYPFWELCAVDDASDRTDTVDTLAGLAALDSRIRIRRLGTNGGIVAASNAALEMASGDLVALLDHDDLLAPEALLEVASMFDRDGELDYVYSDEDKLDLEGARVSPFFKPSWSPHLHLCVNYVTHFSVYRRTLLDEIGGFREGFDGSQDYDLSLRATERARRIGHLAKPVYTWRMVEGSTAVAHDAKPYALDAARRALNEALLRRGIVGHVEKGLVPGTWRPRYRIDGEPLVSLLIPTRNGRRMLERCIESVVERTTYERFEIVIVDNGSDEPDTLEFLRTVDVRVVRYPYRFNYARQMNMAVDAAAGDQVVFLNNDLEVITPGWLEAMIEIGQDPRVGAVGARLLFPSGRVQHEGVFVGYGGGSAGNVDFGGYFNLGRMIRDASAVTAACMLMRKEPFRRIGGFDERLRVAFNDVDLCLRLRQAGYQVVYTPYAELFHAESASRGNLHPQEDDAFFVRRWGPVGAFRDPFYNPNFDPAKPFRLRR